MLVPARRWGIGDDCYRVDAVDAADGEELLAIVEAVDGVPDEDLWAWLCGPQSYALPPSREYGAITWLTMAADQARLRLGALGGRWSVWRQDDNGNRYEVSRHDTRAEAASVARRWTPAVTSRRIGSPRRAEPMGDVGDGPVSGVDALPVVVGAHCEVARAGLAKLVVPLDQSRHRLSQIAPACLTDTLDGREDLPADDQLIDAAPFVHDLIVSSGQRPRDVPRSPASTANTARYRSSTFDNSTSANPGPSTTRSTNPRDQRPNTATVKHQAGRECQALGGTGQERQVGCRVPLDPLQISAG